MDIGFILDEIRDLRKEVGNITSAVVRIETLLGSEPIGQAVDARIDKAFGDHRAAYCDRQLHSSPKLARRINWPRALKIVGPIIVAVLGALGIAEFK